MSEIPVATALILVGLAAFVTGVLAMPLARTLGIRFDLVDYPRKGEVADRILPRTGGYALLAAFAVGTALSVPLIPRFPDEWPRLAGMVAGCLLILPLAIADDLKRLSPWPQLLGQIGIAVVAFALGIRLDQISSPLGGSLLVPAGLVPLLTVLWIVGMINTVNFADGVDGLAGGIGCIAATVLFLVSLGFGQYSIAAYPLALAAASLAFLRWNIHPSRLILGTSGATTIGFLLAVFSIIGGAKIATALMVMGLPITDVASVIIYRLSRRRSPFHGGDRAHLHHRLLDLGLSQRQVSLVFYLVCAGFGALALTVERVGRAAGLAALVVVVAVLLVTVANLGRGKAKAP